MKMLGLIFADDRDEQVSEITTKRDFAAIPFGARYRLIDFFISNMTNSGIRNIGIIATTRYESLMEHVRYGAEWDLHRRNSGLTVLPPFSYYNADLRYENVLEALQANISYIKSSREPYVLFTCCNAVGNIDYSAMLEQHIESGARFTCLCTRNPLNMDPAVPATEYRTDDKGQIVDLTIGGKLKKDSLISTNAYIMNREDLLNVLTESIDQNKTSLRNDVLRPALGNSKVMAYETDETLLYIDSVSSYLQSNLALLDPKIRRELFCQEMRPIITRSGNSSPAYYGEESEASNSIIAAGTTIEGTVRNSIIFRGVRIKKGAVVENCVINQDCTIGEGATLNYAVLDKGVIINDKRQLSGYTTHPFFAQSRTVI